MAIRAEGEPRLGPNNEPLKQWLFQRKLLVQFFWKCGREWVVVVQTSDPSACGAVTGGCCKFKAIMAFRLRLG